MRPAFFFGAARNSLTSAEAMGYVLSLPGVSTVVIGCSSPQEVDENARNAREFQPFDEPRCAHSKKRPSRALRSSPRTSGRHRSLDH